MRPSNPTKRSEWQSRIADWKQSGLSGNAWCRRNNLKYSVFLYWKDRLQHLQNADANGFVEVKEDRQAIGGVELRVADVVIALSRDFDEVTLGRLMGVLRRCS
jgi:hypothetical protein